MHLALALPLAFGFGHWELMVILIIALLIFGSRLPKVMRSLGQSVTEFKRGMNEITAEEPPPPQAKGDAKSEPTSEPKDGAAV